MKKINLFFLSLVLIFLGYGCAGIGNIDLSEYYKNNPRALAAYKKGQALRAAEDQVELEAEAFNVGAGSNVSVAIGIGNRHSGGYLNYNNYPYNGGYGYGYYGCQRPWDDGSRPWGYTHHRRWR